MRDYKKEIKKLFQSPFDSGKLTYSEEDQIIRNI